MSNIQWNTLLAGKTTEEMWEIFKVTMDSAVKDFIPTRKTSSKSKPKWMTKAAMRAARSKLNITYGRDILQAKAIKTIWTIREH